VLSTMALGDTIPPVPDERPALASPLWMQYMFDTCATVEEVLGTKKDIRISDAEDHYLVADAKGDCAVIEFLEGRLVVHRGEGLPVRALTNRTYSSCLEHYQSQASPPDNAYHSFNRFARLAEKMKHYHEGRPAGAVDYAFGMLKNVAADDTRWSLVFDTENKMFYLKSFKNPRLRFIDLKHIDFSCDKPALMLDAHAGLSGDITHALQDLSQEAILAQFEKSLKHFRPNMPEEAWKPLIGMMLEKYVCDQIR
jgi:penicillin V acylase-like amidase (Ntn superfamily)